MHIVIKVGENVVLQGILFLVTVFFSNHHSCLGNRRNKRMYHVRRQKHNKEHGKYLSGIGLVEIYTSEFEG